MEQWIKGEVLKTVHDTAWSIMNAILWSHFNCDTGIHRFVMEDIEAHDEVIQHKADSVREEFSDLLTGNSMYGWNQHGEYCDENNGNQPSTSKGNEESLGLIIEVTVHHLEGITPMEIKGHHSSGNSRYPLSDDVMMAGKENDFENQPIGQDAATGGNEITKE